MRIASLSVSLVIALLGSVSAQERADTALDQSWPRFYVAGGLELARVTRFPDPYAQQYGPGVGLSLQAGYVQQSGRLGLRLGLGYFEREREYGATVYGGFSQFYHVSTARTIAANVDVTYDLTRSRFRPYVIGGLAPYWVSYSTRFDSGWTSHDKDFGIALSPGVGFRFPVRRVELFTEVRTYFFSGASHVFSPLTFGVRF
jgi:opacity protein-like surface antigen